MPRYYYHVHDGKSIVDHKGVDLPDAHTARLNAIAIAGRILADEPERLALDEEWCMEVTADDGLVLFRLDFYVGASPAIRDDRLKEERPKNSN